jgi:hypothetical protein
MPSPKSPLLLFYLLLFFSSALRLCVSARDIFLPDIHYLEAAPPTIPISISIPTWAGLARAEPQKLAASAQALATQGRLGLTIRPIDG